MLVDIHNHILPGLDDGAKSIEEAILLATNAVANGITHIIATPHHQKGKYTNTPSSIFDKVEELNAQLAGRNIPIQILAGMELHLHLNMLDGQLLTLANSGKYLLIELPAKYFPASTFDMLYKLQIKGYIPIIAHPEKNLGLIKNKEKLIELVKKGALLQITASSVLGKNGRRVQAFSKYMLDQQFVHFIASDAHNVEKRPFLLKQAYAYIERKYSPELVKYLMENAKHVVQGTEFHPYPPLGFT